LKALVLPHDSIDFRRVLDALHKMDFLGKYKVDSREYGFIPTFLKHQRINGKERPSDIPKPLNLIPYDASLTPPSRKTNNDPKERKGKERKGTTKEGSIEDLPNDGKSPLVQLPLDDSYREKSIEQGKGKNDGGFGQFWLEYPGHEKRLAAESAWKNLSKADRMAARTGVAMLETSEQWQDPQFIPMAASYLNGHRWEDEPTRSNANGTGERHRKTGNGVAAPAGKKYPEPEPI